MSVGPGFHCAREAASPGALQRGPPLCTSVVGKATAPRVFHWWGWHVASGPACAVSLRAEPGGRFASSRGDHPVPSPPWLEASSNPLLALFTLTISFRLAEVRERWHERPHCRPGAGITSGGGATTSDGMRWEVTVFSIGVAGPRGGVCSLPHRGWESIHLRIQLCLAQLFYPGVSEHTAYSSTAQRIAVLGQGGALPTMGALVSPRPCPEAGEGSGTAVGAIGEPELFGAFYQPELRNQLRHSFCSKQFFVSFATPKKKEEEKRVTTILK